MSSFNAVHSTLAMQVLSIIGAATAAADVCYIFYVLTNISHWRFNHLSPQGVVVVLCACSIYGCVSTWVGIPYIVKRASLKARLADPVKRASLLGLVSILHPSFFDLTLGL